MSEPDNDDNGLDDLGVNDENSPGSVTAVLGEPSDLASEEIEKRPRKVWERRNPDKAMAFWRTMSGKQTKFLSEAGTKKEKVAISMAGIAKPTKDLKINLKTTGKTRVWSGSYDMREPTGKTTFALGIAETSFPLDSLNIGKSWSKEGIAFEANCGLKWARGDTKGEQRTGKAKDSIEGPAFPPMPYTHSKIPTYDASVTLRTSVWYYILPPLLLSIGRRLANNKPSTTYKAGVQFPYSNDTRSIMAEGTFKPESHFYSGRCTWFYNPKAFVGFEASNKRSYFSFIGSPLTTPSHQLFQGPVWKEMRSHMILFATIGMRNDQLQFGVHMTWK